jgi:hypothetical protein
MMHGLGGRRSPGIFTVLRMFSSWRAVISSMDSFNFDLQSHFSNLENGGGWKLECWC